MTGDNFPTLHYRREIAQNSGIEGRRGISLVPQELQGMLTHSKVK